MTVEAKYRVGALVRSVKGRDNGRLLLVIGVDGDRVLVADGRLHPVKAPKKKNPKHIVPVPLQSEKVEEWARAGHIPGDHELRRILEELEGRRREGGAENGQGGHH